MTASGIKEGDLLWTPSAGRIDKANLTHFMIWLRSRGRPFDTYGDLWQWSIDDQDGFWGALWEYFDVRASKPYEQVLGPRAMPGAGWFPGTQLNYAEHALRHEREGADALVYLNECDALRTLSWSEIGNQVRKMAMRLRGLGIAPGDRVVAYLPNGPEAVVAMLATTSVGAIWASCGPDFGARGVVDRFAQLQPKLAFFVDGYFYGGKRFDRRSEIRLIVDSLPSLKQIVYVRQLEPDSELRLTEHTLFWEELLAGPEVPRESFQFERVRSPIPCGSCFPPVPQVSRSRSSILTVVWSSSKSRRSGSIWTCIRASACSSSRPPAG